RAVVESPSARSRSGASTGTSNSPLTISTPTTAISAAISAVARPPVHSLPASTPGRGRSGPPPSTYGGTVMVAPLLPTPPPVPISLDRWGWSDIPQSGGFGRSHTQMRTAVNTPLYRRHYGGEKHSPI